MSNEQNIRKFRVDLERVADAIGVEACEVVQQAAGEIWVRVIARTPVDTGYAQSGWTLSSGAPSGYVPRPGTRSKPRMGQMRCGDVLWVVNNVEYINELENGHSKQAPSGMLGVTVAEIEDWMQRTWGTKQKKLR